jgi:hypothetical protein
MTDKAKLNNTLIKQHGWQLMLLTPREAVQYLMTLDASTAAFLTKHAQEDIRWEWSDELIKPNIGSIHGLHSSSIYVTRKYDEEDLLALNAKQLSYKRKNITDQQREYRNKFPKQLADPHGVVIELRGWHESVPTVAELFSEEGWTPKRKRKGK